MLIQKVSKSLETQEKVMKKDRSIVQKLFNKFNTLATKDDLMKLDDRVGKIFSFEIL